MNQRNRKTQNAKVVATKVNADDEVVRVLISYADKDIVIRTNDDYFLRLKPDEIPLLGRATKGVKGIKLSKGDYVKGKAKMKATASYDRLDIVELISIEKLQ